MDQQLIACPVCTLYLREGMSMHSHLNTHPKDQVIEALVRIYTQERSMSLQLTQPMPPPPPPPMINPFQVVSEEHIFLGRQQVTNIIHAPLMSYPIYSQQQVLNAAGNEYLQAELSRPEILGISQQPEPLITALINVPDTREYDQAINTEPEDEKVEVSEDNEKCYIEISNTTAHSPASNHSGITVRTDLTNVEHDQASGEYITSDCDFQDEDARHSEDLGDHDYDDDHQLSKEMSDDSHLVDDDLERSSSGLNIQADECMPARGELSGHGSINTVSSIWIREEPLDGMPQPWEEPDKDTKKKYLCLYCEQEFNCPKERRVHVATLHCNNDLKNEKKKVVMCTKCGLQLNTVSELQVHTRAEHKRVQRQCGICQEEFPTQDLYMEHIVKIHPLECRTCGKTFHSKPSLCAHAKIHLTLKPHACTLCPKTFITTQKLKEHMNGHTGYAPIQCNLCDKRFKRYSNLKQHKDSAHFNIKKKAKEFFCECGETFMTKKKLEWHREIHEEKPKQCMYCSERYIHNSSLTRHIRKAHNSEYLPDSKEYVKRKNVSCPICNATFVESSLRAHMKQHGAVKQYGCIVCGKKFLTKWNLNLHRWTHASRMSKPYKCTMCKSAFIRQNDLQSHIRAHYGSKPFTCNFCGKQFNRKYNWIRHEKEHKAEKKYTCEECGKTFHRNYYLVDHLRIHTGIKPYSCHICNKTSSTKSNHNKHIRTHHAREAINTES